MAMLGQVTAAVQVVEEGAARVDAEEAAEVAENDLKSSFSLFIHLPICRENVVHVFFYLKVRLSNCFTKSLGDVASSMALLHL